MRAGQFCFLRPPPGARSFSTRATKRLHSKDLDLVLSYNPLAGGCAQWPFFAQNPLNSRVFTPCKTRSRPPEALFGQAGVNGQPLPRAAFPLGLFKKARRGRTARIVKQQPAIAGQQRPPIENPTGRSLDREHSRGAGPISREFQLFPWLAAWQISVPFSIPILAPSPFQPGPHRGKEYPDCGTRCTG